jgi:uncharacterized protein (TIGR02001 family)
VRIILLLSWLGLAATSVQASDKSFPQSLGLDVSGEVSIATDGVTKGVSDSDGNGQFAVELKAKRGPFYAEIKLKNIKNADGARRQVQPAVGFRPQLGPYKLNLMITQRNLKGTREGIDNEFIEYQADISRRWGKSGARLTYMFTPDGYGRTKAARWTSLSLNRALTKGVTLSGGYALRRTKPARNYAAYNLGLISALSQDLSLDIRYYSTDKHEFGKRFKDRTVIDLTRSF